MSVLKDVTLEIGWVPQPPYEVVAREYYDAESHPTCNNFGELSRIFIAQEISRSCGCGWILEVGAGRSVAAALLDAEGKDLSRLTLLDSSPAMLSHSDNWRSLVGRTIIADAKAVPLPSSSCDLIIASLGDPYNEPPFWREVSRLLRPGGYCLFTSPAHDWSEAYRNARNESDAEFALGSGESVSVPSFTRTLDEQLNMSESNGLRTLRIEEYRIKDLKSPVSAKLLCVGEGPIMVGYTFQSRV